MTDQGESVVDSTEEGAAFDVLVVDDEESMRHFVSRALKKAGHTVRAAEAGEPALELLREAPAEVLVSDVRMPGIDGTELMARAQAACPGIGVVLMTAYGNIPQALEAVKAGAETYLTKPFETEALLHAVERAGSRARLSAENRVLREMVRQQGRFAGMIGESAAMRALFRTLDEVARRDGTVLISGESGTGKELVARALHQCSPRAKGPFVAVHCAGLPENLVEAELFGAVAGAFTGAVSDRKGYVERAEGGTLFLDEVGELPVEVQPVLLRFLDRKELIRVGDTETRPLDVRVVAASHRDLKEEVARRRFRDDLYFRLGVLPLHVPPLRERTEDIPLLVAHFFEAAGRTDLSCAPDLIAWLQGREWPGNVRELQNLAERLAVVTEGSVADLAGLPEDLREESGPVEDFRPYRQALEGFERGYLEDLLQRTAGNVSEAARLGGLSRPSLHARISALGIDVDRFRDGRA